MNNELAFNLLMCAQVLFALFTITEKDFIKKQMDKDRANMSKPRFRKTWAGRIFFLIMPSLAIISILCNPL